MLSFVQPSIWIKKEEFSNCLNRLKEQNITYIEGFELPKKKKIL